MSATERSRKPRRRTANNLAWLSSEHDEERALQLPQTAKEVASTIRACRTLWDGSCTNAACTSARWDFERENERASGQAFYSVPFRTGIGEGQGLGQHPRGLDFGRELAGNLCREGRGEKDFGGLQVNACGDDRRNCSGASSPSNWGVGMGCPLVDY